MAYGDQIKKAFRKIGEEAEEFKKKQEKERKEQVRKYRREASRKASKANKRLQRLERNKLTDAPAYQGATFGQGSGKPRFSIKGKSYNEVQAEMARMNKFIEAETSTVRGANNMLKDMAKSTGIKYKNLRDLKAKSSVFFQLASQIEDYLRSVEDMASAIGYQKIWEQINEYVEKERVNLEDAEGNVEALTEQVVNAMDIYKKKDTFIAQGAGFKFQQWYSLSDDDF